MVFTFLALLVATICIQVPNIIGVSATAQNQLTVLHAAKLALYCLPVGYLASMGFTLFYGRGNLVLSYPMLTAIAMLAALLAACIIQVWLLNTRSISVVEMVGLGIAITGTAIAIFNQEISAALGV